MTVLFIYLFTVQSCELHPRFFSFWSTWNAVGNLTPRAGELSEAHPAGRMIGIGLRAREPYVALGPKRERKPRREGGGGQGPHLHEQVEQDLEGRSGAQVGLSLTLILVVILLLTRLKGPRCAF